MFLTCKFVLLLPPQNMLHFVPSTHDPYHLLPPKSENPRDALRWVQFPAAPHTQLSGLGTTGSGNGWGGDPKHTRRRVPRLRKEMSRPGINRYGKSCIKCYPIRQPQQHLHIYSKSKYY